MTVCMYKDIHTTTLYYWPHTTGMPHLKITFLHVKDKLVFISVEC